ncbi:hypothetical protein K432DRAFT_147882 [Lepidopterella palustris CBS 459.81]|uniref:RING-type domain-containing protein n=1 Tax=Lepidopterella palustris CBS 459.81 TaxID=1314670 RepID=A0A8E2EHW9_9PEZI|nr:hypothetical protein K432DRAFT_147882 [Lepidopterella palustris CBS 459.81]
MSEIPPYAFLAEMDGPPATTCGICLSHLPTTEPCAHLFCASCINPWLASHNTCPACRAILFPSGGKPNIRTLAVKAMLVLASAERERVAGVEIVENGKRDVRRVDRGVGGEEERRIGWMKQKWGG